MRYAKLTSLKLSKELSRKGIWAFDIETKDGLDGKELFCWALSTFSNGKRQPVKVYSGKSIDSFFSILVKLNNKNRKQTVYVHNLSFDVRFLIDYCIQHNINDKPIFANSNVILYYIDTLNYRFIDSFQFLLTSQEIAEEVYNVPTELTKIDCSDIFKKDYKDWSDDDKKRVLEHNKNDVLALQYIMKEFRKQMYKISNVDVLHVNTLASFSLRAFRKELKEPIVNPYIRIYYNRKSKKYSYILEKEKYEFAKQSYFGGRTECFNHQLIENVNYYDVVSMFPAQMMSQEFPCGIPYWETDSSEIENSLQDKLSIIEATLIPNYSEIYPVLPFRFDNKTIFGNLKEKGIWCSCEIKYALTRGYRFKFHRALIFPFKFNPFKDFITTFFTLKKNSEKDTPQRNGAKITLNSSYGKFGQRIEQDEILLKFFSCENEAIEFYNEKIDKEVECNMEYNEIYQKWFVRYKSLRKTLQTFQIVHLSSFITAYARVQLIRAIHSLTDKGYVVYYCDTDSIVASNNPILKLSKELGCWDIECSFDKFKCLAPKCYIAQSINFIELKDKRKLNPYGLLIKVKGVRRDKIKELLLSCKTIDDVLIELKKEIHIQSRYLSIKSSFIRFKTALSCAKSVRVLSLQDKKRKTLSDLTTIPLVKLT